MALASKRPRWLNAALDKPVAVLGRGVSGEAAGKLIERLGGQPRFFDEGSDGRFFDDAAAASVDLAISSPGFPSDHRWVNRARENGCRLLGETDFASLFWKGPIIAITGTNGKTTLTEFLAHAFSCAGMEVRAAGNIGTPLSYLIADDANTEAIAVCELSSFQTESLQCLDPDCVVWTNFDEDHLDRHRTMQAYFEAKHHLVVRASASQVFYDVSVAQWAKRFDCELDPSGLAGSEFDLQECDWEGTAFAGRPGLHCFRMAHAVWNAWGLGTDLLVSAARSFRKSPHRMEFVCEVSGAAYWNDSKATNFHATSGALSGFTGKVLWIGGGKGKGGDIAGFARRLIPLLKEVYLIGETKFELQSVFQEHGLEAPVYDTLERAVEAVGKVARAGDQVVFSPGFASFDLFDGYAQRGELFKKAVAQLSFSE